MKDKDFSNELVITTSRSGGPGGQSVNKVNSKVTLRFDVNKSEILSDSEKEIILKKLGTKLTKEGTLIISAQNNRSQLQNREAVLLKFHRLIEKAFTRKRSRKATKPTRSSVQKRIKEKKMLSEKKKWRQSL